MLMACASLIAACACQPNDKPGPDEPDQPEVPAEFTAKRYNGFFV